jgi:ELWxxDGT repeat protein
MKNLIIFFLWLLTVFFSYSPLKAQVSLVKDILPGAGSSITATAHRGIAFGDRFIFPASTPENGLELWISNGTENGTLLLKDINSGTEGSDPHAFFVAFGKVYFNAFTANEGKELWVTDGTQEGTQLVMDIEPGVEGSDPIPGDIYNGYLYFAATANADREVWRIDSLTSPHLFRNVNPTAQSRPRAFKAAKGLLYFSANVAPIEFGGIDQDEPFVTDGTEFGTVHLDIEVESPAGGNVNDFESLNGFVFFLASAMGGALPSDILIYSTQGDQFSTGIFASFLQTPAYWLMPVKGKINFCDEFTLYQIEADDFSANVNDIARLANPLRKTEKKPLAYLNGNLCIPGKNVDNDLGVELYFSDGDVVWPAIDINPGTASSDPWYIVSNGSKALFAASSSETNRELYESDGTSNGTKLVADLYPGDEGSNPTNLVIVGNNVYFYAMTPETGIELFKYELAPNSSNQLPVLAFEGKVYPQPAQVGENLIVEWPESVSWISADLISSNGYVVKSFQLEGEHNLSIETDAIASGTYVLHLNGKEIRSACKVIIQ